MAKNFVSNKDETVRMFKSDILEFFSRVHFTVPLFIYLPVIAYFFYRSAFVHTLTILQISKFVLFGIAVWTLIEYLLHRFVFHYEPKSSFGKKMHFMFHGVHHDYPSDSRRLVMPPAVSIPLASLFYFLFQSFLGGLYIAPFFIGFIGGYLFYDITHYAVHHFNMHSKFWLAIKNHHMKHHYLNSSKGYGVSSPVWDIIIGTNFPSEVKKKITTLD